LELQHHSDLKMQLRTSSRINNKQAPTTTAKTTATPSTNGLRQTFLAILKALLATFFTTDATAALNRSAIFLIFFLCVHMAGNLFIFAGPDVFNTYGYFLHINPVLKIIEIYLAFGFIMHALSGCYKSYKKRHSITKSPLTHGKLLLSSVIVTSFLVLHLYTFKFGKYYNYLSNGGIYIPLKGTVAKGTEMRDIYKLAMEVFASPLKTWIYIVSIAAVGQHMWWGWDKTIKNNYLHMGLNKETKRDAIQVGHVVIVCLTLGFIASPVYVHYVLREV
jgi:succinate dehydrogenase / fumarate reductase cytochrome b subunit